MTGPCVGGDRRGDIGAYVLDALDPAERVGFEAHLAECAACRAEVDELAPVAGALGRLDTATAIDGPAVPEPALLDRMLTTAAAAHRRTRHRWLAAAAAAALIAGGTVPLVQTLGGSSPPRFTAAAGAIHASVQLVAATNGTQIDLTIRGVRPQEQCTLVAVSRTGHEEVAGSWVATYEGDAWIRGTTAIPKSALSELRVVDMLTGRPLVIMHV